MNICHSEPSEESPPLAAGFFVPSPALRFLNFGLREQTMAIQGKSCSASADHTE